MHMFKWTALALSVSAAFATMAQTANPIPNTTPQENTTQPQEGDEQDIEIVEVKGVKQADLKARDLEGMRDELRLAKLNELQETKLKLWKRFWLILIKLLLIEKQAE